MNKIALIGGSGFIGRHIANRLNQRGWQLSIASRKTGLQLHPLQVLPRVQLSRVDLQSATAMADWLAGHDAVISMAGILHGSRQQFQAVHADLPARIVEACRTAGVPRLLHISALGAATDAPSLYQQSKAAGEQAVRDSGLDWTILRPSVVFGRGDNFLTLFVRLNRLFPLIPLAGAQTRFQPVWVEDVAHAVEAALDTPASIRQTLDLVGPQRYTLAELVRYTGRLSGHPRPVWPMPMALGMLQAGLLACLPGEPLMSRDNLRSLARDNISDQGFPQALLGFAPQALEAIAPDWLKPAR
ncbi:complex I NDUFA9 subunit family protein [Paludibacterium sp. THUN1379]|uniref:complex I NDUFA9 subunit family protein n=1 Tax=Paludibacterium sp. THUN1379 TaxID=3112107 RepID=UPI00308C60E2|nr:complex I NDUFA9 subunit family protein [Paludibacterium sp. THUN1379]